MTGWGAVAATTGLMLVAIGGFNVSLWRRMQLAKAARARWTPQQFDASLEAEGCAPGVGPAVRVALGEWYGPGVVPRTQDRLIGYPGIGPDEVASIVAGACVLLNRPRPSHPIPPLATVGDLARYLERQAR